MVIKARMQGKKNLDHCKSLALNTFGFLSAPYQSSNYEDILQQVFNSASNVFLLQVLKVWWFLYAFCAVFLLFLYPLQMNQEVQWKLDNQIKEVEGWKKLFSPQVGVAAFYNSIFASEIICISLFLSRLLLIEIVLYLMLGQVEDNGWLQNLVKLAKDKSVPYYIA